MRIPSLDPRHCPLSDAQTAQFNALVASLDAEQAPWLLGYLAGVAQGETEAAPPPAKVNGAHLTVLFASQTGNAAKVAKQLVAALASAGVQPVVMNAADFPPAKLGNESHLVLITSTQGEGDPPDAAVELRRFLFGKRAPRLEGLRFAVLSLGDYSYANFCKAGADFDQRLQELGAQRVLDRVDCDLDFQSTAEAWQAQVVEAFKHLAHRNGAQSALTLATAPIAGVATNEVAQDKDRPFSATVLERIDLNGRGSAKKTVHIEVSLTGSGMTYQPGDSLGVLPRNAPAYVRDILEATHLAADASVSVDGQQRQLIAALTETFEITTITRPFVKAYVAETKHAELGALLEKGQEEGFRKYTNGREIIDVLQAFPPGELSAQGFVGMLRRLQPRLYSIASSLLAHEEEVHLLVGLTRYESHGRTREGVCSSYLCERLGEDEPLRVYLSANPNFKLPENQDARIIMIGPGTGLAPFRAFIEEREALGCRGRNWLFFGDQHFATDFLYQLEWQRWHKSGVLSRLDLAFSRDQAQKVYVQHRMLENARELWSWLQDGAYFYVCGDARHMAKDVHQTLIDIAQQQGGLSPEAAAEYVNVTLMRTEKRYLRDVY